MMTPVSVDPAIENKVSKAKSLLILDHPFFGMTVARRPLHYSEAIPSACMSATGQITLNPTFVDGLNTKQLMFLLAHEALHYMFMHSLRLGARDMYAWNVACDKVINDTLTDAGVGEFIDGGVTMRDARNYAAEELYDEEDGSGQGNNGGVVGGCGNDVGKPVGDDGKQLDDATRHKIEAQTKIETIQSAKAAKAVGKLPGSIERVVDAMLEVKTPWHTILERFMQGKIRDGYNWRRPNRRFIGQNVYLPGVDYVPKMGHVVIGVDTSGSIGQAELNEFNAHINRILETCNPEKVTVKYCDSVINHTDEYTPEDFPVRLTPHGGGGTSFRPVFDWIENECSEDVECCVYLTDGYGDQKYFTSAVDTIWLTTGSDSFDWGTVVEFESGAQ